MVDTEGSVEFWRWKYRGEFGNDTKGRARLWDTALKFFFTMLSKMRPVGSININIYILFDGLINNYSMSARLIAFGFTGNNIY